MWVLISFLRRESHSVFIHSPRLYLLFLSLLDIGNYEITCLLGFHAYGTLQSREEFNLWPTGDRILHNSFTLLLQRTFLSSNGSDDRESTPKPLIKGFSDYCFPEIILWKISHASSCLKLCILGAKIRMHSIDKNRKSKRNIQWNPLVFTNTPRIFY